MSDKLKIFCVTNKPIPQLESTFLKLVAVGKEKFNDNYIDCSEKKNIYYKEKYYSELTFHYWYWKNLLKNENSKWVGFCQKRRFWIKKTEDTKVINKSNYLDFLLEDSSKDWENFDVIICDPIKISGAKKIKIVKRGFKNIIKEPSLLWKKDSETLKIHFDMHHGYGNLDKAISVLNNDDRNEFNLYVNNRKEYNPHLMFIARPQVLDKWFSTLFTWLENCENIFGFENLKGYDTTRIYAYLAERYQSFWFKKYCKYKTNAWVFIDN